MLLSSSWREGQHGENIPERERAAIAQKSKGKTPPAKGKPAPGQSMAHTRTAQFMEPGSEAGENTPDSEQLPKPKTRSVPLPKRAVAPKRRNADIESSCNLPVVAASIALASVVVMGIQLWRKR